MFVCEQSQVLFILFFYFFTELIYVCVRLFFYFYFIFPPFFVCLLQDFFSFGDLSAFFCCCPITFFFSFLIIIYFRTRSPVISLTFIRSNLTKSIIGGMDLTFINFLSDSSALCGYI